MKYEFDNKRHRHTLDGKPLFGITTILGIIAKPALIQWSADMGAAMALGMNKEEGFFEKYEEVQAMTDWVDKKIAKEALTKDYPNYAEARLAHRRKKEGAGDIGTAVHEWIEQYVIARINNKKDPELPEDEQQNKMVKNFVDWSKENTVVFLESEKHLYSEKMWTGGIVDMVFMMDGKKYIGDIKTSSGIYDEAFFQMAGYHLMLEEMGGYEDIQGYIIINLQKNGKMELKMTPHMETNKEAFLSALSLHKIIKSLK